VRSRQLLSSKRGRLASDETLCQLALGVVPCRAEIKKNATAEWLSKTRIFERVCRTGKVTGKSGLNLS
jgi:hypothetical protein